MNVDQLRRGSVEQWEAVSRHLLPSARKEGCHLRAGSSLGEPGRSFDINLRKGVFGDWAFDDKQQCGLINLWKTVRNVDFKTAVRELSAFRGNRIEAPQGEYREPSETKAEARRVFFPRRFGPPTELDFQVLSRTRNIVIDAWRIAAARGLIHCFDDPLNGRCWFYTDQRRRCGLRRRLDGKEFCLADGSQHKSVCCAGSDMRTPIGYQEAGNFPALGIIEGAPDSIALLAHAWASGLEGLIAPICMPSATANFTDSALAYLQNKRARIFIDNDDAGRKAAGRWATQLVSAGIVVDGFSFAGLVQANGQLIKDLNDLLKIDYDCWEQFRPQVEDILNFAF